MTLWITQQKYPQCTGIPHLLNLFLNINPSKKGGLPVVYTLNEIWWRFLTKRYTAPTAPQLIQSRTKQDKGNPREESESILGSLLLHLLFGGTIITRQYVEILHQTISNLASIRFITIKAGTAAVLWSWHARYQPQNPQNRRTRENLHLFWS